MLINLFSVFLFWAIGFSSILVIISRESVNSLIYLVFIYILLSFIYLILGAEFLAVLLIIVYVGAIAILFLFVLMMLNLRAPEKIGIKVNSSSFIFFLGLGFILLFFELNGNLGFFFKFSNTTENAYSLEDWFKSFCVESNIQLMSYIIFNEMEFFLIILGNFLLFSLIGCISISLNINKGFESISRNTYYSFKKLT